MKVNFLISFHLRKTSASQQLWWNLIALEREEPFSHLDSHDGWWKLMMIVGAPLWLTFFSPFHSSNQVEVVEEKFHGRVSTPCHSVVDSCCLREARCLIDHSFEASTFIWLFSSQTMVGLELDEEMSPIVWTMTATAFCLINAIPMFLPSFYFGSMLFINNH